MDLFVQFYSQFSFFVSVLIHVLDDSFFFSLLLFLLIYLLIMASLLAHSSNITLYQRRQQQQQLTIMEEIKAMVESPTLLIDTIQTPTPTTLTTEVVTSPTSNALITPPITPTSKYASSIPSTRPHSPTLATLPLSPSSPSSIPPSPSLSTANTTTTTTTTTSSSSTPNVTHTETPASTSSQDVSLSTLIPIAATQLSNIEDSPCKEPAYYTLSTGIQKAIRDMQLGKSQVRNLNLEWYRLAKLIPIKSRGRTRVMALARWIEHRDHINTATPEQLQMIVADLRKHIFELKEEEFMNIVFEKRKSGTKDQIRTF